MSLATAQAVRVEETARVLGNVSQIWLEASSALRREAVTALQVSTGFSRGMIESALAAAFEELTEEKILRFCAAEPGFRAEHVPEDVLHVLAGNVFTAWLPGAVTTLLLGAACTLKPSSREPVFSELWKRSVQTVEPALSERIRIVSWDDDLLSRYPAVVAYGSDATLSTLRAKAAPGSRFIGYGHKISVALLWKEALAPEHLPRLLERLEKDVAPFDLQGCLSPQVVYMEGEDPGLFEGLFSRVRVMPHLKRFESWESLKAELRSFQPHLSALGHAGPDARLAAIQSDLETLGFSRVCPVGEMQQPPLGWRNGGISLVEALTSNAEFGIRNAK